jgi:hypothetical protein
MFWSQREQLKDELRLRLRVAADFATLGAYELSGAEDACTPARVQREDPPQRVFLFAKVAPVCPHSAPRERACTPRPVRATGRTARRTRAGAVHVPEQPCLSPVEQVRDA